MDIISILSTTVLATTIATLVLAVAAYFAYKLREWRRPKSHDGKMILANETFRPIFLKRHMLTDTAPDEHAAEP